MDKNVLYANSLSAGYGKKIVVNGLSFELKAGRILTLIGPNGAGKSTVLKTITAQLPAISGDIAICGRPLSEMKEADIARKMSVLLTEKITAERMTCGDVAATGRYPYTGKFGILTAKDLEIVKNAMRQTSCEELYDTDLRHISDGQRQCVMLARAMAQEPKILLLDEPTSFLDISHKLKILTLLRKLARENNTAVIQSLHELDLAQKFSDTVLCIKDGKADRIGTPEEIFKGDYIAELYGISDGHYDSLYGTAEPSAISEEPKIFVIGGGGNGIPVYRKLQRQGTAFAAGIIHENDIDLPTAKALAAEVITEKAFEPITEQTVEKAIKVMKKCKKTVCCLNTFGTLNKNNEILYNIAKENGMVITI